MPEKLAELQALFLEEARRYGVLPLDDRRVERFDAAIAGRPQLIRGSSQLLFGGMGRLTEATVLNIKNRSHAVTAEVTVPEGGVEGVVIAQGGSFGGWSLYAREGRLAYCYNLFGLQSTTIAATEPLPAGTHQVRMEFDYDGGGPGRGGAVTLRVDGASVAEGRLERTVPLVFSLDETCEVGCDNGSPVSDDYTTHTSAFTGTVAWVQIDIDEAAQDPDHLITPEQRLALALGRQ
jgi:arylsulfatase